MLFERNSKIIYFRWKCISLKIARNHYSQWVSFEVSHLQLLKQKSSKIHFKKLLQESNVITLQPVEALRNCDWRWLSIVPMSIFLQDIWVFLVIILVFQPLPVVPFTFQVGVSSPVAFFEQFLTFLILFFCPWWPVDGIWLISWTVNRPPFH